LLTTRLVAVHQAIADHQAEPCHVTGHGSHLTRGRPFVTSSHHHWLQRDQLPGHLMPRQPYLQHLLFYAGCLLCCGCKGGCLNRQAAHPPGTNRAYGKTRAM
jgi:hypothetical protein